MPEGHAIHGIATAPGGLFQDQLIHTSSLRGQSSICEHTHSTLASSGPPDTQTWPMVLSK